MIIDFTIIKQGEDSCYKSVCEMAIVNSEQWSDFWRRHVECDRIVPDDEYNDYDIIGDKPLIPEIDFDRYSVIAVVAGMKPSTRYLTEILSVETTSSQSEDRPSLSIAFRCQIPRVNFLVGHSMTCPYHLIKIPKIDPHKVIFTEITKRNYKI
jgi:hypothetical protein